jgi:hypothetical protein
LLEHNAILLKNKENKKKIPPFDIIARGRRREEERNL